MKKLIFTCLTAATLTLASCGGGNSAQNGTATTVNADSAANALTEQLMESINNNDAEGIAKLQQDALTKIQELYAAGDSAAAEAYKSRIKEFIVQNKTKLDNLKITDLISTSSDDVQNGVEGAAQAGTDAVKADAEKAASDAKAAAEKKANEAVDNAKTKANEKIDATQKKVNDDVNTATQKAKDDVKKKLGL